MIATTSVASPQAPLLQAGVPMRSPRTSIVLAELARQRRLERRQRGLQRQRRRQAWTRVTAWLTGLGRGPFEAIGTRVASGLLFGGTSPLLYAVQL